MESPWECAEDSTSSSHFRARIERGRQDTRYGSPKNLIRSVSFFRVNTEEIDEQALDAPGEVVEYSGNSTSP